MASKKAAKADNAELPPEFPEAPPAPVTFPIPKPTPCRVVEAVVQGHYNRKVRRPAIVTNTFDGDVLNATALLDINDVAIFGEPCPLVVRCNALTHDDSDDAPAHTWRYPPRDADTIDVER